ncbi:hypothetical protein MMC24_006975 [Lignoscripta atroalba]|nr:hypothetical protein [Lignoscripta atroalba]
MTTQEMPRNRKERRAASKAQPKNLITSSADIPLSQPSRDTPEHKTLYEIAAERQSQLQDGQPFTPQHPNSPSQPSVATTVMNLNGTLSEIDVQVPTDDPMGPFGQALFFSVTLTMLHFTLDVLVHHQYRQEIGWDMIVQRTVTTFPLILFLVYFLHQRSSQLWVQVLFLGMSFGSGCYLIYSSNEVAYFAVMKRAPPLGTLWVWSVIEMRLGFAVGSLAAVGAYFWQGGYTIF